MSPETELRGLEVSGYNTAAAIWLPQPSGATLTIQPRLAGQDLRRDAPLHLSEAQLAQIIAFLHTLDAPVNADPKWLTKPVLPN